MSNMRNDIRYDIDKYCIKQEDNFVNGTDCYSSTVICTIMLK